MYKLNLFQRSQKWLLQKHPRERQTFLGLTYIMLLAAIHYLVFCIVQPFFIEDAAISFAYARNFVDGYGFVSYPGGERVEGFSNALWTFLIALFYGIGFSPFVASKILGMLFCVGTLPYIWGLTSRMIPRDKTDDVSLETYQIQRYALLAPLLLVLSPQFIVWSASGLENSLYIFLLSMGMYRIIKEDEDISLLPWSGFVFCLVSMTRPEGMMYVVVAFIVKMIFVCYGREKKQVQQLFLWLFFFIIPFSLYHAWRMWYFSWEFPNTYYAKLGTGKTFQPFSWHTKGWKYINKYLENHVFHAALIFFPIALAGIRGWRFRLSMIGAVGLFLLCLWDGKWDGNWGPKPSFFDNQFDDMWIATRVWYILIYAVILGLLNLNRQGWKTRSMMWTMGAASTFFVVYSGGDWMKAHRWLNIVEIFLLPIVALGIISVFCAIPSKSLILPTRKRHSLSVSHLFLGSILVAYATIEIKNTVDFCIAPETSVNDIHRRVRYMKWVQDKLDVDHITLLDVDMGAHVYYSGWDIVDIAGLIDVPMGQHQDFHRSFIKQYIFEERKPDFAHVHGGWARTSRIDKQRDFTKNFIEIDGYPISSKQRHIGNHINKRLFVEQERDVVFDKSKILFGSDLTLVYWDLPVQKIAAGGVLMLDSKWMAQRSDPVQVIAFITDGQKVLSSAAFELGYGFYDVVDWKKKEVVQTKMRIPIPDDISEGEYSIRLLAIDSTNQEILSVASLKEPVFMKGEFDDNLHFEVVSSDIVAEEAIVQKHEALALAQNKQCGDVWASFKKATYYLLLDVDWKQRHQKEIKTAIATCYLSKAIEEEDEASKVDLLVLSRYWDFFVDGYEEIAYPLALDFDQRGKKEQEQKHFEEAYALYRSALLLNPSLSWTRNRAEDARDASLQIIRPSKKSEADKNKEKKGTGNKTKEKKGNKTKENKTKENKINKKTSNIPKKIQIGEDSPSNTTDIGEQKDIKKTPMLPIKKLSGSKISEKKVPEGDEKTLETNTKQEDE